MAIEIKAPVFPESVADGTVATWHKKPGEAVARDELIVDIETDKVVLEVLAPADGVISKVLKNEGDTVLSQEVLAIFEEGAAAAAPVAATKVAPASEPSVTADDALSPAVRKMIAEHNLDPAKISATGKGGRLTKEDVDNHLKKPAAPAVVAPAAVPAPAAQAIAMAVGDRVEKRVPMTRLRAKVAERLLEAKQSTAMLTTFNEVNMKPVMELRKQHAEKFEKVHGVRLGFMSFFVKAATEALKRFPAVNASIDGTDIVYHGFYDVGVAVSSDRGLVVPILRNTEQMSLAEVEKTIGDFGKKAKDGKLTIEEMTGGTFTISNGGVFGSLLSTPILNLPQTAILGMHKIQERPMAVNGQVVIQPMMYLALSYDHRMIDGKEAVSFLVAIKELVEDPARLLLEI
ncbi:MAG: 2-oxoglutarate dehydrogenase complex dihydrolipoyllysine-residue succinyltransferase [Moraxellaceae bacterium]|mgnify:FL=1|jgi:2-oxoglutarate dehydrogenase E2 component (dihydrolipoamide succinyltransferase)|nr:2-oxoglutarate dehydrogenase complex dihydrolipoyllysine-residue succinyltransferase [Moraxellaceae bacterium]MBP9045186.1 2-oxoglutarate dehydrogenase complex dihydrolipoyllysine-residue succinyltransferase [Moraxellaceae bacterium]MBP9730617.1 2-oxoglutarate dehydrogenase complex dihydrolipoyllysine-residue succinyltransferase [Moraxellaceae bacterium]MCC6200029.1 2-oxoglutarate dehydrogenase complex dihydrolipoyllysine-residue succinyltransferase [Moraxellaceae bacterium]HQV41352.1 2-oxog